MRMLLPVRRPIHPFTRSLTPTRAELRVKTVKYFKSIERVQDEVEVAHRALAKNKKQQVVQTNGSGNGGQAQVGEVN